jgi:hypothetical protein
MLADVGTEVIAGVLVGVKVGVIASVVFVGVLEEVVVHSGSVLALAMAIP